MDSKKSVSSSTKTDQKRKGVKKNPWKAKDDEVFDKTEHMEFSNWVVANEEVLDSLEKGKMAANLEKKNETV